MTDLVLGAKCNLSGCFGNLISPKNSKISTFFIGIDRL